MASFHPKPFGKYFLVERIAVGGMAEIYKAKTFGVDGFEKLLAIKKILPHYSADKEFIAMLTDEAKLVVRLSHTNIVQIYDLGKVGDDYYISMEFIDGVNLREVINRARELKEKIPLPLCLYILSEICKGLDYAHSKRDDQGEPLHIVHRDVSPQNILLSFEGETKIVDFGIAKAAMNISHTSAGILKGKVTYMSPEQAVGKPIDGRTDIFSAAIILYEMITGERLFGGDSQIDILNKIRSTPLTEDTLKDKVPDEVRPVLAKALAFQVKDRFETAGDLQIALTKLLYSKYSDFSSKNLSLLIKKLFANELKIRKKKAQDEASISSEARQELEKFQNQKSLIAQKTNTDSLFYQDTTRPEEKIKAEMFKDTAKPEDQIHTQFKIKPEPLHGEKNLEKIVHSDPPTQKSISINFKKALPPSKYNFKRFFIFLLKILVIAAILFGIYSLNPLQYGQELKQKLVGFFEAQEDFDEEEINNIEAPEPTDKNSEGPEPVIQKPETQKERIPEPETIDLKIKTNVDGAQIFKNGETTGLTTPATLKKLVKGQPLLLVLKKEGYVDLSIKVSEAMLALGNVELSLTPNITPPIDTHTLQGELPLIKEIPATNQNNIDPVQEPAKNVETKTKVETDKVETPKVVEKAPEPVVKEVSVQITSNPKGALLFIDGTRHGETPVTLDLSAGTHKIKLTKVGYQNLSQSLKVAGTKEMTQLFTLKAIETKKTPPPPDPLTKNIESGGAGFVRVDSNPRGASVTIDGTKAGITPVAIPRLKSGGHSIVLSKPGYRSWNKNINVGKTRIELNANLQKE